MIIIPKSTETIWIIASAITILILGASCNSDTAIKEKRVQEVETEGKISSIIRNPVTLDGPIDTVNVAKMAFDETVFDFGEVPEGKDVEHIFHFTNTGLVPLVIDNAQSTCGCTVPSWPKQAIQPGQSGEIRVSFDTNNRTGVQEKPVTITANIYPSTIRVYLKGYVTAPKSKGS